MNLPARIGIFLLWLLHFLPHRVLIKLGRGTGHLLWLLMPERRHITLTNLALCFPDLPEAERTALAREHFALYGRTIMERTILWWEPEDSLRQMIRIEGVEHLDAVGDRPVILFTYHFVGMDVCWTRLSMLGRPFAGFYAQAKNPVMDDFIRTKRLRFGHPVPLANKGGLKAAIQELRKGTPVFYLPDLDHGRKHSIFVPFFGVTAATIPSLSRMAASTGAAIVPVAARLTDSGWVVRIEPAWSDFPSDDTMADTRRMNAYIEACVREYPAQYWWTHKRFKTRPEGEKSVY